MWKKEGGDNDEDKKERCRVFVAYAHVWDTTCFFVTFKHHNFIISASEKNINYFKIY